jgi:mannosyltransferase OCH1-like enzyme
MQTSIPKIIVQTSRQKPPEYVVNMIQNMSNGWDYQHYTDDEIIQFFKENPIAQMSQIVDKFYSLSYGEHRADLFRYYFLFINGGVFIDSDAMIEENIDSIVNDYSFFSVNSSYYIGTIFQGFIGCTPRHPIIEKALIDIYNTPDDILKGEFHLLCKNLYTFYNDYHDDGNNIHLYQERTGTDEYAEVVDLTNNKIILKHYYKKKIIPH